MGTGQIGRPLESFWVTVSVFALAFTWTMAS